MKGFKNTSKGSSGFKFPTKFGFSSSSGEVQQVRGYTRAIPQGPVKKAMGGRVFGNMVSNAIQRARQNQGQGNTAQAGSPRMQMLNTAMQRARENQAAGRVVGRAGPRQMLSNILQRAATGPQMQTAIPRAGMARRPIMRAKGGRVYPGGGRPHIQNKNVRANFATSAIAASSPDSESKESMKSRMQTAQDRILGKSRK